MRVVDDPTLLLEGNDLDQEDRDRQRKNADLVEPARIDDVAASESEEDVPV
jgi:hypothetical protein